MDEQITGVNKEFLMKIRKAAVLALGLVLAVGLGNLALRGADGTAAKGEANAGGREVIDNPSLLISPSIRFADLTFYGVKLGDSIDKIPNRAGVTKRPSDVSPGITYCAGQDIAYLADNGRIYQIVIGGDRLNGLPPCDTTLLQIILGKADSFEPAAAGERVSYVSYLQRQARFAVTDAHTLRARITEVTLYAP
jgi:hypothetical protein